MGGFTLFGPNVTIAYVHTSDIRCKCLGLRISITEEQEKKFMGNNTITLDEFNKIFDNKYINEHIYVSDNIQEDPNKQKILNYTIKAKDASDILQQQKLSNKPIFKTMPYSFSSTSYSFLDEGF